MATKYTAIIIEPRQHRALQFVLDNFLSNLSDDWSIILFHGNTNIEYAQNIVKLLDEKYSNRVKLVHLNINNLTGREYSRVFMTKMLYYYIPTETCLVFQTDSMIIPENKDRISEFLQYDYVGAPWKWASIHPVGNGGLSLRKKSKMLEIIKHKGYTKHNEDVYFSHNIPNTIRYNVPTGSEACKFSVETIFYDSPFGIHNCWRYLPKENMDFLMNTYSDIQELMNLQ